MQIQTRHIKSRSSTMPHTKGDMVCILRLFELDVELLLNISVHLYDYNKYYLYMCQNYGQYDLRYISHVSV